MTWLIIALAISVPLNIFFGWYIYNALKKLQFMSNAFETLDLNLESFDKHLKHLYEQEMYYGDQTLQNLIKHSQQLLTSFDEVRKDYEIFNGDIDEDTYFDEEEQNDATEKNNSRENLLLKRS